MNVLLYETYLYIQTRVSNVQVPSSGFTTTTRDQNFLLVREIKKMREWLIRPVLTHELHYALCYQI